MIYCIVKNVGNVGNGAWLDPHDAYCKPVGSLLLMVSTVLPKTLLIARGLELVPSLLFAYNAVVADIFSVILVADSSNFESVCGHI